MPALFLLTLPATAEPIHPDIPAEYQLAISFDLEQGLLTGTARVSIMAGETLTLDVDRLRITGILLKKQDGSAQKELVTTGPVLTVPAGQTPQELFVSYTFQPKNDPQNIITPDAITLISDWYPQPRKKMHYQLSATLPEGFTAVSESDVFPLARTGNSVTAALSQPLFAIHFAAARYVVDSIDVRKGLKVYTLFFPEDQKLAHEYLRKSREFIRLFENEIGPYPYNYFATVANRNPTGLGMPTFTLLGQAVLRLPFIKDTSLGHEILHSWFGNSIEADTSQGNWCEGLTSYLADYAFRVSQGEGAEYRKEAILNYISYVHDDNVIPLSAFTDAGHAQPEAQARRAVGYSRAMLFFQELHERIGHTAFMQGIRTFYHSHLYGSASWDDLRQAFAAQVPGKNLSRFFIERLTRTDIPSFHAENIEILQRPDASLLTFTLVQDTEQPFALAIPVQVTTAGDTRQFTIIADKQETAVELELPDRPFSFTLDPETTFLRHLAPEESPAIWSKFLGSEQQLAILQSRDTASLYLPLIHVLKQNGLDVHYADEVPNSSLGDHDLLFLGLDQPGVKNLFATPALPENGFSLEVRRNPLNPEHVAVLVASAAKQETTAVAYRLTHYGKYGYLHFQDGRVTEKHIPKSSNGIQYIMEEVPAGGATNRLDSFAAMARQLADYDVVYIGEQHTSASDHLLQLRLAEAVSALVPDLAIGMEMFPATAQPALDEYVLGQGFMSEKDFLKASRYFEVWQFDYRYYREIFTLARQKRLQVLGLNLERDIVSTVYRTGGTDQLSRSVRNSLPQQRDLDLPGYSDRLLLMQSMHEQEGHGSGKISGFIQAQGLWDETMAQHIAQYLQYHPGRKMLVLAGNEHTRKDSGIPPRVARRIQVSQATVINVTDEATPGDLQAVADYFFFSEPMQLPAAPMMGVMLSEQKDKNNTYVEVSDFSPESKAPQAGLKKGDILLRIGTYPIATMADVRIAMVDMETANSIQVQVERRQTYINEKLDLTIELIRPQPPQDHP